MQRDCRSWLRLEIASPHGLAALGAAVCLCVLIHRSIAQTAPSQPPATRPAVSETESSIHSWLDQLADADPNVRERAMVSLMGLHPDQLSNLRQLVAAAHLISPTQAAALHDVVIHVFLSGKKYPGNGGRETDAAGTEGPFFLGLFWTTRPDLDARLGLCVDERLPGFPAYRFLKKGDMILGIYINPQFALLTLPNRETHTLESLKDALRDNPAIQDVALEVLRGGESMKIALKMAPLPSEADAGAGGIGAFTAPRLSEAEAYWKQNFMPVLEAGIPPSNLVAAP